MRNNVILVECTHRDVPRMQEQSVKILHPMGIWPK